MKKLVLVTAIAASTFGVVPVVQAEVTTSANVGLYSDYRFRGVSQTEEGPAIQGGFDVDFGNGFYLGNWNSSLGAESYAGTDGIEMDFYGGYAGEINGVGYDVGLLQYYYPGATDSNPTTGGLDINTLEIYGSASYMGFSAGLSYAISDYFGVDNSDGTTYFTLGYEHSFSDNLSGYLHYGMTSYDGIDNGGSDNGLLDYDDYAIGVTYTMGKYEFGAAYIDTDLPKSNGGLFSGDSTVVVSVSTSF